MQPLLPVNKLDRSEIYFWMEPFQRNDFNEENSEMTILSRAAEIHS